MKIYLSGYAMDGKGNPEDVIPGKRVVNVMLAFAPRLKPESPQLRRLERIKRARKKGGSK